jgi:hypothetical protein
MIAPKRDVMRLADLLPPNTEAEWTCGHVAGAVCAECYRQLAAKAHALAEENRRLRDEIAEASERQGRSANDVVLFLP